MMRNLGGPLDGEKTWTEVNTSCSYILQMMEDLGGP